MAKNQEGGSSNPSDTTSSRSGSAPSQPGSAESTAGTAPKGRTISERKGQYLIAARRPVVGMQTMNFQPLQFSVIEDALRSSPDIEVVDTVGAKNVVGALSDGMGDAPSVLVARMTEQKANMLHQQAQGRLVVERDQHLALMDPTFRQPTLVAGSIPNTGPVMATAFTVFGKDNAPLADAEVYLFGSLLPASGVTDARGQVSLSLFGETPQSIRGLYVKPKADYWSFYQRDPDISTTEGNVVMLRPLSDWPALADFPNQQAYGWGQKAMRLDQLPATYRGQGVKIAVIDSGAATTHDDLSKIRFGFDIVNKKTNPNTWNEDTVGHGSHCAGVIAGADNAIGVRGFAPDAEIHICKLFPGGQISQLIDALEYCIEKQIDVVNLSLGGAEPSEALEQQILRAKRAGVACVVAAGNSGGAVQYPASSPNVLAVAAIGKLNEFPPDSYHSETLTQFVDANGFFSAKFTCYGTGGAGAGSPPRLPGEQGAHCRTRRPPLPAHQVECAPGKFRRSEPHRIRLAGCAGGSRPAVADRPADCITGIERGIAKRDEHADGQPGIRPIDRYRSGLCRIYAEPVHTPAIGRHARLPVWHGVTGIWPSGLVKMRVAFLEALR
jgi:subtilisin